MQPWNPTLTSKSATLEWGTRIMDLNSERCGGLRYRASRSLKTPRD